LIEMGATFPFLRMGFDLVEREDEDWALLNGREYYHHGNDYREGCGNHDDHQLFELV
jgi:hypothetical protein